MGDSTLKEAFLNIFNIARRPNYSINSTQGWHLREPEPKNKFARLEIWRVIESAQKLRELQHWHLEQW